MTTVPCWGRVVILSCTRRRRRAVWRRGSLYGAGMSGVRLLATIHIFQYHQSAHTRPKFCKRDLVPPLPDFNDNFALLCISSDLYVQPEDGLTGRGRNM